MTRPNQLGDVSILKPCPFCGKVPLIVCPDNSYGSAMITCGDANECPVDLTAWGDLATGETIEDARRAWNTRSPEAAAIISKLVEALEVFARCPTHGKHGGRFVIANAVYEDMCAKDSAPREAYWHKSDFDKAREALSLVASPLDGGGDVITCRECDGVGWTVEAECCHRAEHGCGGRGCTGPDPVQVQCECCSGTGEVNTGTPLDREGE